MEMDKLNSEAELQMPAARGSNTEPNAKGHNAETVLQMPATQRHNHWDEYKKKLMPLIQLIIGAVIILSLVYSIFMTGAKTSAEEKLQVLDRSAKQLFQLFGNPAIGAVSSEWTKNSTKI